MVSTRAQTKGPSKDQDIKTPAKELPKKRTHSKTETSNTSKKVASTKKAKKEADHPPSEQETKSEAEEKPSTSKSKSKSGASTYPKLERLIEKYGAIPLSDTALEDPQSPKSETILALLLNALFSSARTSHELAAKTIATAIKADYHKIDTLRKSSWDERTQVLTDGGYTRYREKTATGLGELVELIDSKYEGDLNNLLPGSRTDSSSSDIRKRLKEIKGLGDVGIDIFMDTAQAVWPCLAPFLDPRSAKTADSLGLPSDAQTLWESKEIDQDPVRMCKLTSALTNVRLNKHEGEFK
ncbi:hypothetical protein PV11_07492 [Exophiala sideris]|uniref:HhH-GPD domain-containing protein n=1 Tax=Exophiala sideris TaxID=1016849 RepID=A0A0D1YYW6_9EURO|nr:hypothetical protein PV11_07492 [Exophiala sideris]